MSRRFYHIVPLALAALAAVAGAGCAGRRPPVGPPLYRPDPTIPVVFVAGITGNALVDPTTGDAQWGTGKRVFFPRDRGYGVALPLVDDPDRRLVGSRLEPGPILEEVRVLGVIRGKAYRGVLEALVASGLVRGDLARPRPGDALFTFSYDWRRDDVDEARRLVEALERLRVARGEERLRVALVCQSNGGYLCRWAAKYGAGSLDDALAGRAGPPSRIEVTRIVLVGTASDGALRILRFLHDGRRYVQRIGRLLSPEALFTFPSLYEDLPADGRVFLDERGRGLDDDLGDPETWRRLGLSIFDPEIARRADRRPELFGDEARRLAFLAERLERARRFHAALRADPPGYLAPAFFSLQNPYDATPVRVVLARENGRTVLRFPDDPALDPYLAALTAGPGDGHASLASQESLSPAETAALRPPFHVAGDHFELILAPQSLRRLVEMLGEPVAVGSTGR